ncbi:MAG: hypothetical protein LBS54_02590 [Dysgonamonadaceae bacterium]|jgi:ribosomal protein S12 methylthiotransferase accessory factor YcaO|nr:hypothetical protein [Dysgonamonadaceae bacterium]
MKTLISYLFAAVLIASLAACSGGKKDSNVAAEPAASEVSPAPVADIPQAEDPAKALKAFEEYAKEFAAAHNNVLKDPQKYQNLARQAQEKIADLERLKVNFDKKEEDAYKKSLEIVMKVLKGGK